MGDSCRSFMHLVNNQSRKWTSGRETNQDVNCILTRNQIRSTISDVTNTSVYRHIAIFTSELKLLGKLATLFK